MGLVTALQIAISQLRSSKSFDADNSSGGPCANRIWNVCRRSPVCTRRQPRHWSWLPVTTCTTHSHYQFINFLLTLLLVSPEYRLDDLWDIPIMPVYRLGSIQGGPIKTTHFWKFVNRVYDNTERWFTYQTVQYSIRSKTGVLHSVTVK